MRNDRAATVGVRWLPLFSFRAGRETDFLFDTEQKTIRGCIKGLSGQTQAQFVTVVARCNGAAAAVCWRDGASDGLNIGSRERSARRSAASCKSAVRSLGPNNNSPQKILHIVFPTWRPSCAVCASHYRVTFHVMLRYAMLRYAMLQVYWPIRTQAAADLELFCA